MNVIISPNVKKISERIDPAGNVINARTKEIIKPVETEYVAPIEVDDGRLKNPNAVLQENLQPKQASKMDEMINKLVEKKVEEMVAKKVEEALSKL